MYKERVGQQSQPAPSVFYNLHPFRVYISSVEIRSCILYLSTGLYIRTISEGRRRITAPPFPLPHISTWCRSNLEGPFPHQLGYLHHWFAVEALHNGTSQPSLYKGKKSLLLVICYLQSGNNLFIFCNTKIKSFMERVDRAYFISTLSGRKKQNIVTEPAPVNKHPVR